MATTLYKNKDGKIVTEQVRAEYVYACLQDGWVCSLAELEPKKKTKKKADKKQEELSYDD